MEHREREGIEELLRVYPEIHAHLTLILDQLVFPADIFRENPQITKIFEFYGMAVRNDMRRKGIASELIKQAIEVKKYFCKVFKEPYFVCFVLFLAVSSLARYRPVFTKSLRSQADRSVLWPGDWQILLLCIYVPAPFTESFDRLGKRMIFKVTGAGIELELHSSSWPFSERLFH